MSACSQVDIATNSIPSVNITELVWEWGAKNNIASYYNTFEIFMQDSTTPPGAFPCS